jgi:NAD(P)-dependent dehydrogenase (short-subunit alcohol dehydrogenase family)
MPDVDELAWDRMFDINVKGTFFAIRALLPLMKGGGNIVLTGSIDGVKPVPAPVHFAAAKGALKSMAQTAAKEAGGDNVRINVIAPGVMEAGVSRALPPEILAEYVKHCGLKRTGKLTEIAAVIAWFALHNTYVTGQTILVDGAL